MLLNAKVCSFCSDKCVSVDMIKPVWISHGWRQLAIFLTFVTNFWPLQNSSPYSSTPAFADSNKLSTGRPEILFSDLSNSLSFIL